MNCISCGAPLKYEGAKFCSKCGAKQPVYNTATKEETHTTSERREMSVVKKRIFWNVKPGEIAYRINEAEFINYDNMLGLVINEGTTAYVSCGGKVITEIHGGTYDFVDQKELDNLLETKYGGLAGGLKRSARWLANLIFGQRVRDSFEDKDEELSRLRSFDDVIRYAQGSDIFSVTLKQDREFQLIFGENHENTDDFSQLIPMKIRTKYHDVELGIRAFFKISDYNTFASFYLTESNRATVSCLAKMLTPLIRSTVQQCLADIEMTSTRLEPAVCQQVEAVMRPIDFHGISLVSVVEISANNEDLERMQTLARELYLSELELVQLQRTNDFKNRLNSVTSQQMLAEARDEKDLYFKLQEINKDSIISEEELRKFYVVLSREQRIFDAQSMLSEAEAMDKINASLADMERTGLLRQEELDLLQFQIKEREYKRGYAVQLMQVKDAIEYEKLRTGGEQEVKMQALKSALALAREQDDYNDDRILKQLEHVKLQRQANLDFARQQQEMVNQQMQFELDMQQRDRQGQFDILKQMAELDLREQAQQHEFENQRMRQEQDHAYRMAHDEQETLRQRDALRANMTYEQIAATQLSELDASAQKEFAHSLSAGKDLEQERRLREEQNAFLMQQNAAQMQQSQQTMQSMQSMMSEMMQTVATMSGNMVQNRNEQREEYRSELHRQQQRHDMHQNQALNYTTRHLQARNEAPVQNIPQQPVQPQPINTQKGEPTTGGEYKECPQCHRRYDKNENFCVDCGCFM